MRFLLVDDSLFMRRFITDILIKLGHEVVGEAENGMTAVAKYIDLMPDAVTMDITMKEMTGLEALKQILTYDSDAKVIMVSSMSQKPVVTDAIVSGARGFLVKPFSVNDIAQAISKL